MSKCFKKNYRKTGKKKYYDVDADVAQLKRNNNNTMFQLLDIYMYIYKYIYIYIYTTLLNNINFMLQVINS